MPFDNYLCLFRMPGVKVLPEPFLPGFAMVILEYFLPCLHQRLGGFQLLSSTPVPQHSIHRNNPLEDSSQIITLKSDWGRPRTEKVILFLIKNCDIYYLGSTIYAPASGLELCS